MRYLTNKYRRGERWEESIDGSRGVQVGNI